MIVAIKAHNSFCSILFHSSLRLFYWPDGELCPKVGLFDKPGVANFPILSRVLEVELAKLKKQISIR